MHIPIDCKFKLYLDGKTRSIKPYVTGYSLSEVDVRTFVAHDLFEHLGANNPFTEDGEDATGIVYEYRKGIEQEWKYLCSAIDIYPSPEVLNNCIDEIVCFLSYCSQGLYKINIQNLDWWCVKLEDLNLIPLQNENS